jgi:hypothetical protein
VTFKPAILAPPEYKTTDASAQPGFK